MIGKATRATILAAVAVAVTAAFGSFAAPPAAALEWSEQTSNTSSSLQGVTCYNPPVCYTVGQSGTTLYTDYGGNTWYKKTSAPSSLSAIHCTGWNRCLAVGGGGTIVVTTNNGSSWQSQNSGTMANFEDITCSTASHCVAVGSNEVRYTTDGGTTWRHGSTEIYGELHGVACASTTYCVAVGDEDWTTGNSAVLVSTDGGAWWNSRDSKTPAALHGVSCLSPAPQSPPPPPVCVAVGDAGATVRSVDGGTNWTAKHVVTIDDIITSISCKGHQICYAVATDLDQAQALYSYDAGASWQSEAVPQGVLALWDVSCPSVSRCIAVGHAGKIVKGIDTTPPGPPAITSSPTPVSPYKTARFEFSGEPVGTYECRLDTASFAPCTSGKSYSGLSNGAHTFEVRQIDLAGNEGDPAAWTWAVAGVL